MDIRYKLDDSIGRVVFENARNWAYQYNPNPNDEIWSKYISSRSFVRSYAADTYVYLAEIQAEQTSPKTGDQIYNYVMTYSVNRDGELKFITMQHIVD